MHLFLKILFKTIKLLGLRTEKISHIHLILKYKTNKKFHKKWIIKLFRKSNKEKNIKGIMIKTLI